MGVLMRVNFVDLKEQYKTIKNDILSAITSVLEDNQFVLGSRVKEFEEKYAAYSQTKYGVGVASGTDAILLALKSFDIRPGDEVITAANTFMATVLAISYAGATPVLIDNDPVSYNIDPTKIEAAINSKTKAIIPVHLYGQMADMDAIIKIAKKHKLKVIEDACQAHGAEYKGHRSGSMGDIGCFSFYPSKNLGAYGDGGMVITHDEHLYEKLKMLRDYGQLKKYHHEVKGFNSRLDSIQAAVLLAKLPYLENWNNNRRALAKLYNELLSEVDVVTPFESQGYRHIYHLYVIRTKKRDQMFAHLNSKQIFCGIHYPIPIHLQKAYKDLPYKKGDFPITERYAQEILSLPMFPELKEEQIRYVIGVIKEFLAKSK